MQLELALINTELGALNEKFLQAVVDGNKALSDKLGREIIDLVKREKELQRDYNELRDEYQDIAFLLDLPTDPDIDDFDPLDPGFAA